MTQWKAMSRERKFTVTGTSKFEQGSKIIEAARRKLGTHRSVKDGELFQVVSAGNGSKSGAWIIKVAKTGKATAKAKTTTKTTAKTKTKKTTRTTTSR